MKSSRFNYYRPDSLLVASDLVLDSEVQFIAGGQSLGPMMNLRLATPAALVDLRQMPALRTVVVQDKRVLIGAAITHAEIEDGITEDPTHGMLSFVARAIAYRAIRNRGTVGGSIAHCDPAADWVNALTALNAEVVIHTTEGQRSERLETFIQGPYRNGLQNGEIIVAIGLIKFSRWMRWAYYKICPKVGEFADAIAAVVTDSELGYRAVLVGATETKPWLIEHPLRILGMAERMTSDFELISALKPVLKAKFTNADEVFIHQHSVALVRALRRYSKAASVEPRGAA